MFVYRNVVIMNDYYVDLFCNEGDNSIILQINMEL